MSEYCGEVGVLTQHISGEDGPTVGWEFNLGGGHHVWCGELSRASFDELEPEHKEVLGDDFGWFIVLYEPEPRVLGRVVDKWAARDLAEMLGKALYKPSTRQRDDG